MIKENARIIFNIINGIEDSFEKSSQEGNNLLLSKNEYSWCKNDQQMLEKLEKEKAEQKLIEEAKAKLAESRAKRKKLKKLNRKAKLLHSESSVSEGDSEGDEDDEGDDDDDDLTIIRFTFWLTKSSSEDTTILVLYHCRTEEVTWLSQNYYRWDGQIVGKRNY